MCFRSIVAYCVRCVHRARDHFTAVYTPLLGFNRLFAITINDNLIAITNSVHTRCNAAIL